MTLFKHIIPESPIGEITIIWKDEPEFIIEEIFISTPSEKSSTKAFEKYEQNGILEDKKSTKLDKFLDELDNYLNEREYTFSLNYKPFNFQQGLLGFNAFFQTSISSKGSI